jgi:hypothetical protein
MSRYQPAPEGKDPVLWEIAQKRASFKTHAVTYIIVNAFLWGIWYLSTSGHYDFDMEDIHIRIFPWPLWCTLGWGIGLAFHFAGAYIFPRANSVESEYEKLKNKK